MTIVINDPEIEAMLSRMAEKHGLTPEALVAELANTGTDLGRPDENSGKTIREICPDFFDKPIEQWHHSFWTRRGKPPLGSGDPVPKEFYDWLSD